MKPKKKKKKPNKIKVVADRTEHNKRVMLEVLAKKRGIVTRACEAAKIGRTTFYEWTESDEAFKKAVDDVQEQALDFVEGRLLDTIESDKMGSVTAQIFYLKCKGKKRGYVERTEITGADGKPLNSSDKMTTEEKKKYAAEILATEKIPLAKPRQAITKRTRNE